MMGFGTLRKIKYSSNILAGLLRGHSYTRSRNYAK